MERGVIEVAVVFMMTIGLECRKKSRREFDRAYLEYGAIALMKNDV